MSTSPHSFRALTISNGNSASPRDIDWVKTNIPCQEACPAGTDIPGYIEAITLGEYQKAFDINFRDNVFPGVLGRVCSRPCEGACRHGRIGNGDPVAICSLKRSSDEYSQDFVPSVDCNAKTGLSIAVIGSGVGGLASARDLAILGHQVTVFEKHEKPGGMLIQGIPAFRLPREVITRDIDNILALEIELRCGINVGVDESLDSLIDTYDAVILAAGTLNGNRPNIKEFNLSGIEHGLDFLLDVNEKNRRTIGKRLAVIGGGYTAMDCARTGLRLGARTNIYYRRGRSDMVVLPGEVEELIAEGGGLKYYLSPREYVGDKTLQAIAFSETSPTNQHPDVLATERKKQIKVEVDHVVLATGQVPDISWIDGKAKRIVDETGSITELNGSQTVNPKVFLSGDFALGSTTLIEAIAHGRKTAAQVHMFLTNEEDLPQTVDIKDTVFSSKNSGMKFPRSQEMNVIPIIPIPTVEVDARGLTREVELGFDEASSLEQGSRCYLCHYKFEIDDRLCVLCDECINVKPVTGCIVPISGFVDEESEQVVSYKTHKKGANNSLYYNRLWIDQDQCIRCGQCESVCPVDAISIQKVSFAKV